MFDTIGYFNVDLEGAIAKSPELYQKDAASEENDILHLAESDYFRNVAIAKKLGLPEDNPFIRDSKEWYGKYCAL